MKLNPSSVVAQPVVASERLLAISSLLKRGPSTDLRGEGPRGGPSFGAVHEIAEHGVSDYPRRCDGLL